MHDSWQYTWHRRPGLFMAIRYLRRHPVPVVEAGVDDLPKFSKSMIRFALWVYPKFLDRADLSFPIIVAGNGRFQLTLDGRHRISKATWTNSYPLFTVRVPWYYAIELIFPGVFEVEWLLLFLRSELRKAGKRNTLPVEANPLP